MAKTASMYLRIDPEVKADVQEIYARYGMTVTQAINLFLHASRREEGLPFDLRPNRATRDAVNEGTAILDSGAARFADADALLAELRS
ncbi:MAG: type II toxin-antitoxin system RelB/DinJ family antitoxin [Bifidobacteriaceae bacterium]|jgi:DNA-damage-inducible protein J|nr:type II toxin-antitoxin system RelB/DinJ family antitoxin [Bifidobacteriaceae bacterium]